jgi:hypothetical protein
LWEQQQINVLRPQEGETPHFYPKLTTGQYSCITRENDISTSQLIISIKTLGA